MPFSKLAENWARHASKGSSSPLWVGILLVNSAIFFTIYYSGLASTPELLVMATIFAARAFMDFERNGFIQLLKSVESDNGGQDRQQQ